MPNWSDELGAQQRQDFWTIAATHKAKMGQKSGMVTDQPNNLDKKYQIRYVENMVRSRWLKG